MQTGLLIIAHAPLASALRACAMHVYPEAAARIGALDVVADEPPETTLAKAKALLAQTSAQRCLVLTDVYGATPSNVAQRLTEGAAARLVAGVNLPMLLRTVNYLHEDLDTLVRRAVDGGTQCIMQVSVTAPQNQAKKHHDPTHHDHHQ